MMNIIEFLKDSIRFKRKEKVPIHDMQYRLPDAERVLVVSPHPDDEVIGCGGSIALYRQRSVEVKVVMLTDGGDINLEGFVKEREIDIPNIRQKEARRASEVLSVDITFLDFPDGELPSHEMGIQRSLAEIIEEFKPDIVFIPSIIEPHPDHRVTANTVLEIMAEKQDFSVAMYEVGSPLKYNTLVEITPVLELKREALMHYYYSAYTMPELFWDAIKGLNSYRSMLAIKKGYYEAFLVCRSRPTEQEIIDWFMYGSE